jgi:hypothetical protein
MSEMGGRRNEAEDILCFPRKKERDISAAEAFLRFSLFFRRHRALASASGSAPHTNWAKLAYVSKY